MFGSAWLRIGLALAAVALFAAAAAPAAGREPRAHGQRLIAEYRLPPEAIARYAALAAGRAIEASERDNSMFADHSPWVGPAQQAGAGRNPYTLVFTVNGVARAAGQVYAQWQAGWEVHESPIASRELLMAVPGIARTALQAGQALTLTARSTPVSFRGERSVAPMLGLVQTRNLDISEVQVQVWSGSAPLAWPSVTLPSSALLAVAAVGLLGWLARRYWQHTLSAPPSTQFAPSTRSMNSRFDAGAAPAAPATSEVSPAPPAPPAPPPSHRARVTAALHELLTAGLVVPTVPDESRPPRRRKSRKGP